MENSYRIGVVNRYALFLDDDSDPIDVLKAQELAKELKKKTKEAEKENKGKQEPKPKPATAVPRKGIKETQNVKSVDIKSSDAKPKADERRPAADRNSERPPPRRPREDRPQNGFADRDGQPRPPRREFQERRPGFERRFNDNGPDGGERRGPPRPPRDGRDGPRPPRTGDFRNKREFDRRSGSDRTGVKPVDKREGGGAHNWGTHKDDMVEDLNKTNSEGEQTEGEKTETPPTGAGDAKEGAAEPEPAPPVEEEPKEELTLDEWKALKFANRNKPLYNIRKAGEGEDLSQWKNMIELEKKKPTDDEESEDEEFDIMADYPQRVGRQKKVLGIEFKFSEPARRGGPAGRGRGRGRGAPRGRPHDAPPPADERRAPRQTAAPPKVDDNKNFPSLG